MADFSNVVLKPYEKDGRIWYEYNFSSLVEIYNYLSSNPTANSRIFEHLHSLNEDEHYGVPYEESLQYLLGHYNSAIKDQIEEFLILKNELEGKVVRNTTASKMIYDVYGSFPVVAEFVKGNPKCMARRVSVYEQKFITINCNLSYPHYTSGKALRNRGIIILALIKALEKYGYKIRFNVFSISKEVQYSRAEIFYMKVNLKKNNELLDSSYCFLPLCRKEFLRRIGFRIIETTPFKCFEWGDGYGENLSENEARVLLNIPKEDKTQLYFSYPRDMGIEGADLETDTKNFLETIGFQKMIKASRR